MSEVVAQRVEDSPDALCPITSIISHTRGMTPDEKFAEIQTHLPALLFELQRLDVPAGSPTRASVVLPRRLEVDPSDVDGRGAVARILGLPVRWVDDEVVGILVEIPRAT